MIVSIMQPAYLPWLGYFDRIVKSDLHIVLDDVQLDMSSKTKFANRNKVRTPQGWSWLTLPLKTKGKYGDLYLNEIEINQEEKWPRKHLQTLKSNYAKAPFFSEHEAFFDELYQKEWPSLLPLCNEITAYLLGTLSIDVPVRRSADMNVEGEKEELILNLCKDAGASGYISGPFGRDYLDKAAFEKAGIELLFHDYPHPEYKQVFEGFEPYMAAIDLLFNYGPDSLSILRSEQGALKTS